MTALTLQTLLLLGLSYLAGCAIAGRPASVQCETFFQAFMPIMLFAEGYAHGESIFIRNYACRNLRRFIRRPEPENPFHNLALIIFAHETVHVAGETTARRPIRVQFQAQPVRRGCPLVLQVAGRGDHREPAAPFAQDPPGARQRERRLPGAGGGDGQEVGFGGGAERVERGALPRAEAERRTHGGRSSLPCRNCRGNAPPQLAHWEAYEHPVNPRPVVTTREGPP